MTDLISPKKHRHSCGPAVSVPRGFRVEFPYKLAAALALVLALSNVRVVAESAIKWPGGRIAITSDGNAHDKDDIGGTPRLRPLERNAKNTIGRGLPDEPDPADLPSK